jgi:hypothetical protein
LGLVKRVSTLISIGTEKFEKIEVFRSTLYEMVFINILLSFPFIFGVYLLYDLFTLMML